VSSASTVFSGPIPTLTDGPLTLRSPQPDDVDAIIEYSSDPEMARWTSAPRPFTRADAEAWQNRAATGWTSGGRHQFAVDLDGRMIGAVTLIPRGAGLAEIGYGLTAGYRGRGLMSKALRLALAWGFGEAGIDVVHWQAQVGNWASRRAAWAVGFRVDGVTPGLLEHRGARVDGWLAALRRGDRLAPPHPWYLPERITGRQVVLRQHLEPDLTRLVEACRDAQTRYWLSGLPDDYGDLHARQHLEQIRNDLATGRGVCWAVADPGDDSLLAEIAVFVREPNDPYGEVGYWTHPDARGRGLTTEAVQLAVRHALLPVEDGGLGLPRVLLRAGDGNLASQRVAEKAGFTRTGRDRNANPLRGGGRSDQLRFDLLADELPTVR
jgi:RimJ/RimL family protein N-acetyltransferase